MRETGLPFDDIKNLVRSLPPGNVEIEEHTSKQLLDRGVDPNDMVAKICSWYSAWSGRSPSVHRGLVTLFAGTHAIDNRISKDKAAGLILDKVTRIAEGSDPLNAICKSSEFGLKVFDLALQLPVGDISSEPALDEKSCAGTIGFGMEAIAGGTDLLCVAAVEPEISVSSLAILSALQNVADEQIARCAPNKVQFVNEAVAQIKGHGDNPLEVLRRLGGRETAALCGAILAARSQHIPVVLDSVAGFAAAAVLYALDKQSVKHCIFAQAHPLLPDTLASVSGVNPVLPEGFSADPAVGIAAAGGLVRAACQVLS